ncbi:MULTISPECIES: hypothetical protein [unclassified Streptomyces]|uniref:hypothetical protein n=1 Tax=unclassified Streptomyces TaxID=2593676 RepID=UPI0005AA9D72|nr:MULTISPECIES: hypothetical protein [unclassified Streptomyces]ODA74524.1 hypothetical protein APS67_001186 [Streptomyces sp. AVP053U2]
MASDPTEPETFEEADDAREHLEYGVEAPEADTAEQHADLTPDRDEPLTGADIDRANEADLAEQARVVSLDEDDYR